MHHYILAKTNLTFLINLSLVSVERLRSEANCDYSHSILGEEAVATAILPLINIIILGICMRTSPRTVMCALYRNDVLC